MSRLWTPLPHFCGKRAFFGRIQLGIIGLLCTFLLPGCGESTPRGYNGSASSDTLSSVSTAPPNAEDKPPLPGTTGAQKTQDGLPALTAKSVNTALFSAEVKDEISRMERLENAVQELRNDFDAMSPAIVRLVAIEGDIQNLISQLEILTGEGPMTASPVAPIDKAALEEASPASETADIPPPTALAPPPAAETAQTQPLPEQQSPAQETAAPVVASGPSTPEATTPPPAPSSAPSEPSTSGPAVEDMRVGNHPDKVRIVLDVRGKTSFTADLDNQEKILVVELPQAGWNAQSQKSFNGDPLLSSYRTEKLGDHGTMLIIQLKSASTVSYKSAMDNPDGQGQRVIIDLAMPK